LSYMELLLNTNKLYNSNKRHKTGLLDAPGFYLKKVEKTSKKVLTKGLVGGSIIKLSHEKGGEKRAQKTFRKK